MNTIALVQGARRAAYKAAIALIVLASTAHIANAAITVIADRATQTYSLDETISLIVRSDSAGVANWSVTYDNDTAPVAEGSLNLFAGVPGVITYPADEAAFLRFRVETNGSEKTVAIAVAPHQISQLETEPADFDTYWSSELAALSAIPVDARLSQESSNEFSTTWRVNLASVDDRRVYGYISVPKTEGPWPGMLVLPAFGASVNQVTPATTAYLAERANTLTMGISIHNAEPDEADESAYMPNNTTSRDSYYYRWAILAGKRALDYITSRSDWNGTDLGVTGVSQGGGLSFMVAGLDSRVNLLSQSNAALAEHAGLKYNRASGFPQWIKRSRETNAGSSHEIATISESRYFDAVNFAKRYTGPSMHVVSYLDTITPPATSYSANNRVIGPKVIVHALELGHSHPNEYWDGRMDSMRRYFPASNTPPFIWGSKETGYAANAGVDQSAEKGKSISLNASIDLNGSSAGDLPAAWEVVSGPGTVQFSTPNAYATDASFSADGEYLLRFEATDTTLLTQGKFVTVVDYVRVTVGDGGDDSTDVPVAAEITAPVSGSSLASADVTIQWNDTGAQRYVLQLGSTPGASDLFDADYGRNLSAELTGLPTDGSIIYASLYSLFDGELALQSEASWTTYNDVKVPLSTLLTPLSGSVLDSTEVEFVWEASSAGHTLQIGSTPGGSDLYSSGFFGRTAVTVDGLPDDGSTLYIRLWTGIPNGDGNFFDTSVTAITAATDETDDTGTATRCLRVIAQDNWRHLKLGGGSTNVWSPRQSPATGHTTLRLVLRDNGGNANWERIALLPQGEQSRGITLGSWISGQPADWIEVSIPLSAFPIGAFDNISFISAPFNAGAGSFDISIAQIAFTGGTEESVWFGGAGHTDNAFLGDAKVNGELRGEIEACVVPGIPGDGSDNADTSGNDTDSGNDGDTDDTSGGSDTDDTGGGNGDDTTAIDVWYRITNPGGWRRFKMGYYADNPWRSVDLNAKHYTHVRLSVRDVQGASDPALLSVAMGANEFTLGDYVTAPISSWTEVTVPIADFAPSGINQLSVIDIFSRNDSALMIDLGRIEFIGANDSFVFFGPGHVDNAVLADPAAGDLEAVRMQP